MATNNILYLNAAIAGFYAGVQGGSYNNDAVAGDYSALANAAAAFGASVDAAIATDAGVDQSRANALLTICMASNWQRPSFSAVQADYDPQAAVILAQWTEIAAKLTADP